MEEAAIDRAALQEPHRTCVGVRQDRLRTVRRLHDPVEPMRDFVERGVPRDALELTAPLSTDATHRVQHAITMVGPLDIPIYLGAQKAIRERMFGVTGDANGATILDRHEHGARVGTIVWAGSFDDGSSGHVIA
jgi:hypothetical protein